MGAGDHRLDQPAEAGLLLGWTPSVTVSWLVLPLRLIVSASLSPGLWPATVATTSLLPLIFWPSIAVIASPAFTPAALAGPPLTTCCTSAPLVPLPVSDVAMPMYACCTCLPASSA